MALLRLTRQGLTTRYRTAEATLSYQLTDKGWERLEYYRSLADGSGSSVSQPNPSQPAQKGVSPMRQTRLHTGIFHCPECLIEYTLEADESLACDRCQGLLVAGTLEDVAADDEDGGDEEDD